MRTSTSPNGKRALENVETHAVEKKFIAHSTE
jgi:hypothetical protein